MRFFEVVSENYMDTEGRPMLALEGVRRRYPIALHGVGLSIGSVEGVRADYIARLKSLAERVEPFVISDHLCWTGPRRANFHDLLPLPFTQEALALLVQRVGQVQEALGRRILLENVSSYLSYPHSEMTEWEFLAELSSRAGCGILLDVNNVFISARNHGFDPRAYLAGLPTGAVGQVHLAGHDDMGDYLFDTHAKPVCPEVWELFQEASLRLPARTPVMIEWDEDIPEWDRLEAEALRAKEVWENARSVVA